MAFENYGTLKTALADWTNRADLADKIPSFVKLFEARANRELRTHDMVKRVTALTDDGYFTVPTDWLETVALMFIDDVEPLGFVSVARSLELRRAYRTGGHRPRYYTHMDGKFYLVPSPNGETNMELIYRASIPTLIGGTNENENANWLLTRSPDLYLYGSLSAAEPYLKNDDRFPLWRTQADQIIGAMQAEADRASFPQGKLTAKFRSFG